MFHENTTENGDSILLNAGYMAQVDGLYYIMLYYIMLYYIILNHMML